MELKIHPTKKISALQIETNCSGLGLSLTMKTSLKTMNKNFHWHYKKSKLKGVLEITLLPLTNEIILSCKKNREAEWMTEVCDILRTSFTSKKAKAATNGRS
jgi:hypothetical protein